MTAQQTTTVKLSDVLDSVKRFVVYFLRNIKLTILLILLSTALCVTYFFMQKPVYDGAVTFILEEKSAGMAGGLSGLASQFGFDIGSLTGSAGMFAGDNIMDILKSRLIIERVLLSKLDSSKGVQGATLGDLYLDFSGLRKKWKEIPALSTLSFASIQGNEHSLAQDSVLYLIYEKLSKKNVSVERLNKKGSIIKINTLSGSQVFSKLFTERLLVETMKLYIDVKTGTSAANVRRLEQRADSLMHVLNNKSYQSATMQIVDANSAFKVAAVPAEVSQRDKTVNYAIYSEVVKNLEVSRMALANQTPAIQMLDYSRYPLTDQRKSLFLLLVMGIAIGFVIGLVVAFVSYPAGTDKTVG